MTDKKNQKTDSLAVAKTPAIFSVIVDDRPEMEYEKRELIYRLMIPWMWTLSLWVAAKKIILGKDIKTNIFFIDGLSQPCRRLKENAMNWKALDILYNHEFGKDRSFAGRTADFWLGMINGQAMRNRLKLFKQCLREEIDRLSAGKEKVKIFSIASGSAEGVIAVLSEYKKKNVIIEACLLDLDRSAIERGRELASKAGIIDQLKFINDSARAADSYIKNFGPNIIEVVGFLEYRPDDRVVNLMERMYDALPSGGVFLTSTVTPSAESFFLLSVSNWPMIYRTLPQFEKLLSRTRFEKVKIISEPLKMQKIAVCQKINHS